MLKPIAQPGTVRQIEYQLIQMIVPVEPNLDRDASKHAVGKLVIQFRIERAAKRVAWFAVATLVVALILSVPGVGRLIVKLMQS